MPIKSLLARRAARRGGLPRKAKTQIAARVVIRKPASWRTRLLWGGLAASATLLLGIGLFAAGQYTAGHDSFGALARIVGLERENADLREHNAELTATLKGVDTQLHIEQGARQALEGQVARLEEERNRLSHDLALFDNLFPSSDTDGRPTIRGFRIEPVGAAGKAWRYSVLIMRPGQARDSFVGEVQIQVRYRQDGQEVLARTPASGNLSERLEFQRYQRVEGHFQAPEGAKLLGAVARVVDNGRLVAESIYRP
jgi:hypothetical protein